MARRFILEVTDDEYAKLQIMARHFRHQTGRQFRDYTWKDAAADAFGTGINADWEYGDFGEKQADSGETENPA
jgi:uncharacterized protein YbjT (DUF2867 family)